MTTSYEEEQYPMGVTASYRMDPREPISLQIIDPSGVTVMNDLEKLSALIHQTSRKNGFWDDFYNIPSEYAQYYRLTRYALIMSEAGEAIEAIRSGNKDEPCTKPGLDNITREQEELADIVIRALDMLVITLRDDQTVSSIITSKVNYNANRPRMHGKNS